MELTRKQIILIVAVSGAILLLTLAGVLIVRHGEGEAPGEPSAQPTATALPTVTPTPTETPAPTVFLLPLVPRWDTAEPTTEPAQAFVPKIGAAAQGDPPKIGEAPWVGAGDPLTQEILAVGLRKGRTAVLLLLTLEEHALTVAALSTNKLTAAGKPLEETLLKGGEVKEQGAQAVSLAEQALGRPWTAWMALDLDCLPEVFKTTGPLAREAPGTLQGDGEQRAQEALVLLTETAAYLERVPLWKLPALKRAVGDAFASNLPPRELWSLFWTVRRGVTLRGILLPVKTGEGN